MSQPFLLLGLAVALSHPVLAQEHACSETDCVNHQVFTKAFVDEIPKPCWHFVRRIVMSVKSQLWE
jgi:hypothetical protein